MTDTKPAAEGKMNIWSLLCNILPFVLPYPGGTKALTDVSMRIESGKITALVGLSGAGSSASP